LAGSIHFGSIEISDASFYMVKDSSGRMNTPKARTESAQSTEKKKVSIPYMKKIKLDNFSFHFNDSTKGKKYEVTLKKAEFKAISGDAPMNYHLDADVHFDGLVFNPVKGGYLTDQDLHLNTDLNFDPDQLLLNVMNGDVDLKEQKLVVNMKMNFKEK